MTTQNQNQNQVATQQGAPVVIQGTDGKFKRVAQYHSFSSVKAETKEEKIRLFNIMNGSDESVIPLKTAVKQEIKLVDLITNPYESVDEETGEITNGVVTTIFDDMGNVYVTSSKSVYFTLNNLFKIFPNPLQEGFEPPTFLVVEEKKGNSKNKSIDLKLIG